MSDIWQQTWGLQAPNALPGLDLAWRTHWALLDIWTANQLSADELNLRTQNRLQQLIKHAVRHSPYYAAHWRHVNLNDLSSLPPVTKSELMQHFDAWCCDRRVTRKAVDTFLHQTDNLGQAFLGRYAVWTSSGTTGEPGIFVQDDNALAVYDALQLARFRGLDLPSRLALHGFMHERTALVAATGGHFAGVSTSARLRSRYPWMVGSLKTFSLMQPLPDLVQALNQFQPTYLATYPTAALLLAEEQQAGRLQIDPTEIWTGGEQLSAEIRKGIEAGFSCRVRNDYGASEAMSLGYECQQGQLHLHADWMILEPVDKNYQPVAPGEISHTVLLTNLANRLQPLVRYDLGDSIRMSPAACACGSRLPVFQVQGRSDDMLQLKNRHGRVVKLLPLALETALEEGAALYWFQVIQTGSARLRIRLQDQRAWPLCRQVLEHYLTLQGLPKIQLEYDPSPPQTETRSGKLRRVLYRPVQVRNQKAGRLEGHWHNVCV
jgi:phenylacetate-CoA ligase